MRDTMTKKHLGFKGLSHKVAREYEAKGYPKSKAEMIGRETAAKVYREQHG
jgi:hypothetical protein